MLQAKLPQDDHDGEEGCAGEVGEVIALLIVQLGELRAALAAVVAAAFHGGRKLVGPAERTDEQRHKNGHERLGAAEEVAAWG